MALGMKRGRVPRQAAQLANLGLLLAIVIFCGYQGWQSSKYKSFTVPPGHVAVHASQSGFLFKKTEVRTFSAGVHPVLQEEGAASPPAYKLGRHPITFTGSSSVKVAAWQRLKNALRKTRAPRIKIEGAFSANITQGSLLRFGGLEPGLAGQMEQLISPALAKSATEDSAALTENLSAELTESFGKKLAIEIQDLRISKLEKTDTLSPTSVRLPAGLIVQTVVHDQIPPSAYLTTLAAAGAGLLLFLIVRLLFADLIAWLILTPLYVLGLLQRPKSPARPAAKRSNPVKRELIELGAEAALDGADVLEGLAETAEDAADLGGAILEGSAEVGGAVLEGAGEVLGGIGGCLGSLLG